MPSPSSINNYYKYLTVGNLFAEYWFVKISLAYQLKLILSFWCQTNLWFSLTVLHIHGIFRGIDHKSVTKLTFFHRIVFGDCDTVFLEKMIENIGEIVQKMENINNSRRSAVKLVSNDSFVKSRAIHVSYFHSSVRGTIPCCLSISNSFSSHRMTRSMLCNNNRFRKHFCMSSEC